MGKGRGGSCANTSKQRIKFAVSNNQLLAQWLFWGAIEFDVMFMVWFRDSREEAGTPQKENLYARRNFLDIRFINS